ncbi:hypothetical protein [Marinoscillum pacificum]|uniref:hypothetical protein n=1 Tax=Marinoscillum pacificum TaxID=392723 RepID=UPI002157560A|nr:hypothetical protein [Marinoscillum pacificum]
MKLDAFLNRKAFIAFIIFLLAAITAFWPGYFGRILGPMDSHLHRHGLAMITWCMMLVGQAFLIKNKAFTIHRWIGYVSFVLVPIMAFTAFDLVNHLFHGAQRLGAGHFYFIALSVNSIFAFLIIYGLAIYFRKQPMLHARFMVSTMFAIITPITDRLIFRFFRFLVPYAPKIGGSPIVPFFGFVLADVLLIGLSIWDWRSNKRLTAFPVALAIVLVYQYSVMNFYQYEFWQKLCYWFVGLPLD